MPQDPGNPTGKTLNRWPNAMFCIQVAGGGAHPIGGYAEGGLGLHHHGWATPRASTEWTLTHLGSGLAVAHLRGTVATVFPVATAILDLTDWTAFEMAEGWRQTQPDLADLLAAVREAHPGVFRDSPTKVQGTQDDTRVFIEARDRAVVALAGAKRTGAAVH